MSNLLDKRKNSVLKHILVFDTIALLSANDRKPEQDWRNNENLGLCVIPGATMSQINDIAFSPKYHKNKNKAKKFLKFIDRGGTYKIFGYETKSNKSLEVIPISEEIDRQILACAYRLAEQNKNYVVILVTYDLRKMALVAQAPLPNFCRIKAKDIAAWYHNGYYDNKLPKSIYLAYTRMRNHSRVPHFQSDSHALGKGRDRTIKKLPSIKPHTRIDLSKDGSVITLEPSQEKRCPKTIKSSTLPEVKPTKNQNENIYEGSSSHKNLLVSSLVLFCLLSIGLLSLYLINGNSGIEIDPETLVE